MRCSKSSFIRINSGFCAALQPTDAFSLQIVNSFLFVTAVVCSPKQRNGEKGKQAADHDDEGLDHKFADHHG
jgi:hypothetical protein